MPRILVVEDDESSRDLLQKFLTRRGFDVVGSADGRDAVIAADGADALVLDVMLPGLDGWDVARMVRARHPTMPIVMVTALGSTEHEVRGLSMGVDDYVTKPLDLEVFSARLNAALARRGLMGVRTFGDLTIDMNAHEVRLAGQVVEVTNTEFRLLIALTRRPGHAIARSELIAEIWGSDFDGVPRVVDSRIADLRRKLGDDTQPAQWIGTVRGFGYRWVARTGDDTA